MMRKEMGCEELEMQLSWTMDTVVMIIPANYATKFINLPPHAVPPGTPLSPTSNQPTQGVIFLAHHPISEMECVIPSLQAGAAGLLLF